MGQTYPAAHWQGASTIINTCDWLIPDHFLLQLIVYVPAHIDGIVVNLTFA